MARPVWVVDVVVDLEGSRTWAVRTCRIHDNLHDCGIHLALHHHQIYHFADYNDAFPVAGDKVQVAAHEAVVVDIHVREVVEVEEEVG